jgi:hypothetical protein
MEISDMKSHYVLSPNTPTITDKTVCDMFLTINKLNKPVVIDLDGVEDCVNDFYRMFEMFSDLTLLNVESRMLSTIYMTGFDKFVTIYGEDVSFEDKSRQLVNRKLSLV